MSGDSPKINAIDDSVTQMAIEGKTFVKVQCEKGHLQILWADDWANWDAPQSSNEQVALHDRAHQILTKTGEGKGKNKGGPAS